MLVRGINHVVLKVQNLEASDRFYREIIGLEPVGSRGRMRFYSAGAHTHDFGIVEVGQVAPTHLSDASLATGLFHFCFDVASEADLKALYARLRGAGVAVSGGVDHNIMHSFYTHDPDGHVIEFGVDVPKKQWTGDDAWAEDKSYAI